MNLRNHLASYRRWATRTHIKQDRFLYGLSAYAIPLLIGLITVIGFFSWHSHYPATGGEAMDFQVVAATGEKQTPEKALAQLADSPAVKRYDTRLSEAPVWFAVRISQLESVAPLMVEFPSRHAVDIACWDANTLQRLGSATRDATTGAMATAKAGFALSVAQTVDNLLCRASFVGPARLTVAKWPAEQLRTASAEFHRQSGLLDGGLLILAAFMLITAIVNRESTYLLFAGWLLLNLRVAALSAGWDVQWFSHSVPFDWLLRVRLVTITLYYIATLTLFRTLFRDDLERVGNTVLVRMAQWTCLPLLAMSTVLSYPVYLPILWTFTGLGVAALIFLLTRILLVTRSRVAMWYSASLAITLFASLYEVVAAALGLQGLIGTVNSVTAALSSSLLAALAMAEQMRVEHYQRLDAQEKLANTYMATPIGMFTLDLQGRFQHANPALRAMLEADVTVPGRNEWEAHFSKGAWRALLNLVHTDATGQMEIRSRADVGEDRSKRFLVKAALAHGMIEGSLQDVTEQSKATEELQFLAVNDPLTKVLNRRGVEKALTCAIGELSGSRTLALAYLDLDRFKLINDLFGHTAGDEVLKQVCERITGMLTGTQEIGRVGGDEFVILFPDTSLALSSWVCRGIVESIGQEPYRIGDKAFQVRGSIGLVEVEIGTKVKDAISAADRACREAKQGHSDGLVVYDRNAPAFRERASELALMERLSTGAAPDGLFLEMQPIMSLTRPHASLNFEVLLRMRAEDGGVVSGGRVIAAAESSGRTGVIDRWVMMTTLEWLTVHVNRLPNTKFVCMNLSGASLNDERFVQDACAILAAHAEVAPRLCIEITESVALHDLDNTRRFIDKVRSFGCKLALDDFGAGYTSFSYLKELPADVLKIDGSFIVNMNAHPSNIAIVEAIVNVAQNLGMRTIAEWAEDNATVQTLAEIGVDYVQGFAVAKSQSPDKLLMATSAASFIQDADLAKFVLALGAGADDQQQAELHDLASYRSVH